MFHGMANGSDIGVILGMEIEVDVKLETKIF